MRVVVNNADITYENHLEDSSIDACAINIEFFQAHLSSQDSELVDVYYGSPTAIKLVSGDIINVIGLFNEQQDAKGA